MALQAKRRDGMSVSELARETGRDRKTVRKYLKEGSKAYGPRAPRVCKLDPGRAFGPLCSLPSSVTPGRSEHLSVSAHHSG